MAARNESESISAMSVHAANRDTEQTVAEIIALLRDILTDDVSLGATLKFVYPGAGAVTIDGTKSPNKVHVRDEPADCTVEIDPALHLKMLRLETDQGLAFRQGKMRISGDVAVAVRLGPLVVRKMSGGRS